MSEKTETKSESSGMSLSTFILILFMMWASLQAYKAYLNYTLENRRIEVNTQLREKQNQMLNDITTHTRELMDR